MSVYAELAPAAAVSLPMLISLGLLGLAGSVVAGTAKGVYELLTYEDETLKPATPSTPPTTNFQTFFTDGELLKKSLDGLRFEEKSGRFYLEFQGSHLEFFKGENENYELNLCKNRVVKELFRADGKSFIKYNDEIFAIPSDELEVIGSDVAAIDLRIQEINVINQNELYQVIPCVTGKPSTKTNEGIFKVYATYGERYLNGTNADGTTYHVPVKYFFPFDGGIGIHNVYYRVDEKYYNGDYKNYYLTKNGTHGCVNIPLDALEKLAKIMYVGYPVVVYYEA